MVTINIDPNIQHCQCGVYVITFSDGRFYIGSSRRLQTRIKTHINIIKSDFTSSSTCESLKPLKGFKGEVSIRLLEEIDLQNYRPKGHRLPVGTNPVIKGEYHHIHANRGNPLLLNLFKKRKA